jgi:26S proteasome regulatory subunit N7
VLEVLHELPALEAMVKNLYECRYAEFFQALAQVESLLKQDWLASPHYRFIVRELRITSYNQVLAAYKSLSLQHMAQSFGVSKGFIDKELSAFVASGRVRCTIDHSAGLVETRLQDAKNEQYMKLLEKSDALMDQMHKLTHLVQ